MRERNATLELQLRAAQAENTLRTDQVSTLLMPFRLLPSLRNSSDRPNSNFWSCLFYACDVEHLRDPLMLLAVPVQACCAIEPAPFMMIRAQYSLILRAYLLSAITLNKSVVNAKSVA